MKSKIRVLNGLGFAILIMFVLGKLGSAGKIDNLPTNKSKLIGEYIGNAFILAIPVIFFLKARSLRKKLNDSKKSDLLN